MGNGESGLANGNWGKGREGERATTFDGSNG